MTTPTPDAVPAWVDRIGYPFRTRFADLPAGRVHYVDEGTGEPILFVHGTPTWSYEWRHLISALGPRWRCVAPDLLGFGLSERPASSPTRPRPTPRSSPRSSSASGSSTSRWSSTTTAARSASRSAWTSPLGCAGSSS